VHCAFRMPKRKDQHGDDSESNDEEERELINIDFDFFDVEEIDFLALKRLLAQLFQADTELLAVHELAELILSQSSVGTTEDRWQRLGSLRDPHGPQLPGPCGTSIHQSIDSIFT